MTITEFPKNNLTWTGLKPKYLASLQAGYLLYYYHKLRESENSYQELKRSLKDRHTQTQGNCIEIFRQAWPSLSIGRD